MAPIPEVASPQAPDLGFSVSNQKVELDIDLLSRALKGKTELTIIPHSRDLKTIRLNCRQCDLKSLTINGKPAPSVKYDDVYKRSALQWKAGVYQYHMLQERLEKSMKEPPEEELLISLPKSVKLEELDPFSEEAQAMLLSRPLGGNKRNSDVSGFDSSQPTRTGIEPAAGFSPITLSIDFEIEKIRDGMQFIGFEEGDLRYPHAYTSNTSSSGVACCLFPCLDDLTSRCTWEIAIRCAKTIGDALHKSDPRTTDPHGTANGFSGLRNSNGDEIKENFSDEDKGLELGVICSGDMTDEVSQASQYDRQGSRS